MRSTLQLVLFDVRRWRQARARTLLSVIGIVAGSATIVAVVALTGSLATSVRNATSDIAQGADLEITGITAGGFGPDVVDSVANAEGVRAAAPIVRTTVRFGDEDAVEALLLGVDPRAASFAGPAGFDPAAAAGAATAIVVGDGLAREAGLRRGDTVTVTSPAGTATATIGAVVRDPRLDRVNGGVVAVAVLGLAQRLAGKGDRVDAVLVARDPDADPAAVEQRLRGAVDGRAVVDTPALLADQAESVTGTVTQGMVLGGALAVGMGSFLVYTTMSMAALERRRELATMRAVGGRRRALLGAFLGEAALLGLIGGLIGSGLGAVVASSLVGALPPFLLASFGVRIGFAMPVVAIPLGVAVGVGAAVAAAVLPARRAVTVPPVDAMRPEGVLEAGATAGGVGAAKVVGGTMLVVAGMVWFAVAPRSAASAGFGLMTLGAPIVLLGLAGPLTALLGRVARRLRVPGRLAAASLERSPRRVWSTTVAVFMGVGMVVGNGGLVHSTSASLLANTASGRPPDLYVAADTDGNVGSGFLSSTTLLPDTWASDISRVPGVREVAGTQFSYATFGRRRVVLQGVSPGVVDPSLARVPGGRLDDVVAGRGVIVSTTLADALDLSEGATFTLPTATGPVRLPVVDVVESFKSNQGVAVVSLPLLQRTSGRPGVSSYDVILAPGADVAAVEGALRSIVTTAPYPVKVQTGVELYSSIRASIAQSTAAFVALEWVIVAAAALAVLNTFVISVVERRRELGILRAVGTSRRVVTRMVLSEAAAVGAGGTVLGLVGGLVLSVVGVRGLARSTQTPLHFSFSWAAVALAVVAGAVVCFLGAALPARRAARVDVIAAIGYE